MISVVVTSDGSGDVDTATDRVTRAAAELALSDLQAIWPVRSGTSLAGLHVEGSAVVGSASYTDEVRQRGSSLPIVDGAAQAIGESAAENASAAADITDALDGAVSSILRSNLER